MVRPPPAPHLKMRARTLAAVAVGEAKGGTEDDVHLPRTQTGPNPQHLIITLLGDYWFGRKEHLPSAGLVALANEFAITSTSARAALSRLARRGLLEPSKRGRRTFYGLTPTAEQILDDGLHRIMSFGLGNRQWDGSWVVVAFSVPEDQRDVRHILRARLRWLGFAPLYDGVWVSPRSSHDAAAALLDDLGIASGTVFVSRLAHAIREGDPLDAWDHDALRDSYDRFIADFGPLLDRVHTGSIDGAEALVARTRVMDDWRRFPNLDPELPDEALPVGWPRSGARAIFAEVYDALGPIAEKRFREILAVHAPDLV
jgi:phenylacetic acid degradation operon negative regulatory protein